jgi:hypothetical protein
VLRTAGAAPNKDLVVKQNIVVLVGRLLGGETASEWQQSPHYPGQADNEVQESYLYCSCIRLKKAVTGDIVQLSFVVELDIVLAPLRRSRA